MSFSVRYPLFGIYLFAGLVSDITHLLDALVAGAGDRKATAELLPLVYDELRKLATLRLAQEKSGQTLQATALVQKTYLRLVDTDQPQPWNSRGRFFSAAAEAMRKILLNRARDEKRQKKWRRPTTARSRCITRCG
jgi:RNA polymerase sigma factor (TIGR02999 family)